MGNLSSSNTGSTTIRVASLNQYNQPQQQFVHVQQPQNQLNSNSNNQSQGQQQQISVLQAMPNQGAYSHSVMFKNE